EEVAKCGVLLAVIGPNWADARDEDGSRRLDNPTDFLRIEIAAALQRDIPVVPILLDGSRMPKPEQLPDNLKGIASRQGLDVRHSSFDTDMEKLIRGLRLGLELENDPSPKPDQSARVPKVAERSKTSSLKDGPDRQQNQYTRVVGDGRIKIDANFVRGAPG